MDVHRSHERHSADIYDRGVCLCGGGALVRNFDQRIRSETRLPVQLRARLR
ncbi:MAG: hypothetical protein DMG01_27640 [Acidobacteria bacterium]|nr:MAG: hypothetical protein DMG01_27640 [Acidobacteriota bacterium]